MKKYLSFCLASTLALSLTSCAQDTSDVSGQAEIPSTETLTKNLVESTDLLVSQQKTTDLLLAELQEGGYTLESPFVNVDPYSLSPLSAIVLFSTEETATISVEILGLRGGETLFHTFPDQNTNHTIPIYGLYPEEATDVILTATFSDGTTQTNTLSIEGGALPDDIVRFEIDTAVTNSSEMAPGLSFSLRPSRTGYTYAFDANGDVRWFFSSKEYAANNVIIQLENGNLLAGSTKNNSTNFAESLLEMDYTGRIYTEFMINETHHGMVELPSGNILVLCGSVDGLTVEDGMVEIDRQTGEIVRFWDLTSYFPVGNRDENGNLMAEVNYGTGTRDWFHGNSLDYHEGEDTAILSSRMQDAVIEIHLGTGELQWVLSNPVDLWSPIVETKLLTPVGSEFEWQYGQHHASYLPNGDIMLFDNGTWRSKTAEDILPPAEGYSRSVIYRVNENDMSVEQIWQYGKELGSEMLSTFISSTQYLGEDHYLINFGGTSYDEDGNPKYPNNGARKAEFFELKNGEVIFHGSATSQNFSSSTFQLIRRNPYENATQPDLSAQNQLLSKNFSYGALDSFVVDEVVLEGAESFDILRHDITDNGTQLVATFALEGVAEEDLMWLYLVNEDQNYQIPLAASDSITYRMNSADVAQGSYDLYLGKNDGILDLELCWEPKISSIIAPNYYEIQISSNLSDSGWTSETLEVYENTAIMVEAGAFDGSSFLGWEENGVIVSEEASYSFVPSGDRELVVVFE